VLDESFKDESNSVRKRKEYVRAAAFNGIASAIGKIFSKGDLIWIEGRLETRKHDKTIDGVTVPVHSTTVIVQSFKPLNSTQRRKEVDGNKL
jgi:single-stranded DNA-binding protein